MNLVLKQSQGWNLALYFGRTKALQVGLLDFFVSDRRIQTFSPSNLHGLVITHDGPIDWEITKKSVSS